MLSYSSSIIDGLVAVLADPNSNPDKIKWAKKRLEEMKRFIPDFLNEKEKIIIT